MQQDNEKCFEDYGYHNSQNDTVIGNDLCQYYISNEDENIGQLLDEIITRDETG